MDLVARASASPVAGKSVLVTGGTGSFGRAFVRRCLDDGASRVAILSRDELKQSEFARDFSDPRVRCLIGDVRDRDRLALAFRGVDVLVHAAAMKRIEVCEDHPWEAVETNVVGTQNVAQAAIWAGIERAVFLSTDKAPVAATAYGMTKAVAERLWIQSNVYRGQGGTILAATRYGNVIGSRGSVLDIFRAQAEAGVPMRVTDQRCSRFWMTIDDAVDLVMLALREMRGGEVFVPRIGSAPVLTLAAAVASRVGGSVGFEEIGLRPSERLHETLVAEDEARNTYDAGTHYVIEPDHRSWGTVEPLPYPKVALNFSYRSDTNPLQLDAAGIERLVAA